MLAWGRDTFWVGFGVLAVGAMLAEGYLLVVQSASVLGTGVWTALGDATGISQVLSDTRFGSLVQLRGALLFALFALGAFHVPARVRQPELPQGSPRRPARGRSASPWRRSCWRCSAGIADPGARAASTTFPVLQVGAQLLHVAAVSVWIVGLALVALVHLRLPKIAPDGGPIVAKRGARALLEGRPGGRGASPS